MTAINRDQIFSWLAEVRDPEIPVLSLVDLGVITDAVVTNDEIIVEMTPTFVGCPALEMMRNDVREVLAKKGFRNVTVNISYKKPWNSDMISTAGKEALKKFGLAPPPPRQLFTDLDILEQAECPRCGNTNTVLKNTFGPTLCRSIHYCNDCAEAFEQFKPL